MARWRGLHRKFADPCNTCITRGRALIVPRRRPRRANIGPRSKRLPTDTSCTPGASLFNRSSLYRGPHYHEYNCEGGGELRLVAAASGPRHQRRNVFPSSTASYFYSLFADSAPLIRPPLYISCREIVNESTPVFLLSSPFFERERERKEFFDFLR